MPLPVVEQHAEAFGANDTTYTEITPAWDATVLGYQATAPFAPVDIAVGEDGYLFVADSANDRVLVLTQAGTIIRNGGMNRIAPISHPKGLDIDSKLNLLIVNGTNVVYCWNQYINLVGVTEIVTGFGPDSSFVFSADESMIDSVMGIYPVYIDPDPSARFQGIAFGPANKNTVFVTDNGIQRIVQLKLFFGGAVKLANGYLHPLFRCEKSMNVASYGSGAGTVDMPRGITCDHRANIYFTQLSGNFLVQKLAPKGEGYVSAFTLYEDPIMDLNRFQRPFDVALGQNDAIFILDNEAGTVQKFFNKGSKAGQLVSLGKTGLAIAKFIDAYSVAVDADEIVYIAETGKSRIRRFQYSVSESDLPIEQP